MILSIPLCLNRNFLPRLFTPSLGASISGSTDWIRMILPLFESPYSELHFRKKIMQIQPLGSEIFAFKDWARYLPPIYA